MPHISTPDGLKIWYDVMGEGEPLILIGGSSLVHNQWDFMAPLLRDRFKIVLYDQRGAGLSDRPSTEISLEKWVDDLKGVLDHLGIKRAHLFATSNGSLVGIRFSAKYPEIVQTLIHYGIYRFTDQYRKMSRVGERIINEFGIGSRDLGGFFLSRMFGTPPSSRNGSPGALKTISLRDPGKPCIRPWTWTSRKIFHGSEFLRWSWWVKQGLSEKIRIMPPGGENSSVFALTPSSR